MLGVYELFTPSLSVPVREFQHSGHKEGTGKENKTQSEGEELPTPTADYQLLTLGESGALRSGVWFRANNLMIMMTQHNFCLLFD